MAFHIAREEIAKTELALNLSFPKSFVENMELNNGGTVLVNDIDWELIPFKNTADQKVLVRTCNDIIQELESARSWSEFPSDAIPFAFDGEGNYLVFMTDDNMVLNNPVFEWNHETGEVTEVASDYSDL